MIRLMLGVGALAALAACQSLPAIVVTGGDTFEVRYDQQMQSEAQADAKARQHCGGPASFISGETRYDGFAYRTYRCGGGQ